MAGGSDMSTLRGFLEDYLQMRRELGRTDGAGLVSFVTYLDQQKIDHISTAAALTWAQPPDLVQPAQWARRLTFVRGFARYCRSIDGRSEVPPIGLLSFRHNRPSPFFFQDEDIPHGPFGLIHLLIFSKASSIHVSGHYSMGSMQLIACRMDIEW